MRRESKNTNIKSDYAETRSNINDSVQKINPWGLTNRLPE